MQNKIILITMFLVGIAISAPMTNNWGVYLAQINLNLPSLTYPFRNGGYVKLSNGIMVDQKGGFVGASLSPRVVNGDFNNDGYPDAAVILNVVYSGIGYFDNVVFVVLQDYVNRPKVTNGVVVGELATYTVEVFSSNVDDNKIIIQFMDRLPGQPKVIAPSVPTV